MLRQRFVLDTTALTDLQVREKLEQDGMCDGIRELLDLIASSRLNLGISCYVPFPSVYKELQEFAHNNGCDSDVIAKIDTWLVKRLLTGIMFRSLPRFSMNMSRICGNASIKEW